MKILILRTDRLGDTILAAPTWHSIKQVRSDAEISLLTRRSHLPLFKNDPGLKEVIPFPEGGEVEIDRFVVALSEKKYDALLVLHVDREVARLVRRISAPLKIGPLSKIRTWFLFNRPVRQKRSLSLFHEADYNGQLSEMLGLPYRPQPPRVVLAPGFESRQKALLSRLFDGREPLPYLVAHPGMGGSAGNWPSQDYHDLIDRLLSDKSATVILSGTEQDRDYLGRIPEIRHPRFINSVGKLDLVELALLLQRATLFIGPSTGPMHLATALDTPVVTVFSPVRVHQPRRWGPYHSRGTVLVPPVECRWKYHCGGPRCPYFDCLTRVTVDEVLAAVDGWLKTP